MQIISHAGAYPHPGRPCFLEYKGMDHITYIQVIVHEEDQNIGSVCILFWALLWGRLSDLQRPRRLTPEFRGTRSSFKCSRFHWHSQPHFCNLGETKHLSLAVVGSQFLRGDMGLRNPQYVCTSGCTETIRWFQILWIHEQGQDEKPKVIPALLFNFIQTCCYCCCCW